VDVAEMFVHSGQMADPQESSLRLINVSQY